MSGAVDHEYFQVVRSIANLLSLGNPEADIYDDHMRGVLLAEGHSEPLIDQALEWLMHASRSTHLSDILAMVGGTRRSPRVAHPLESASISPSAWRKIELLRGRGILSDDAAERLIEGIRAIDHKDWDDADVDELINEIVYFSAPHSQHSDVHRMLSRKDREFYI